MLRAPKHYYLANNALRCGCLLEVTLPNGSKHIGAPTEIYPEEGIRFSCNRFICWDYVYEIRLHAKCQSKTDLNSKGGK